VRGGTAQAARRLQALAEGRLDRIGAGEPRRERAGEDHGDQDHTAADDHRLPEQAAHP